MLANAGSQSLSASCTAMHKVTAMLHCHAKLQCLDKISHHLVTEENGHRADKRTDIDSRGGCLTVSSHAQTASKLCGNHEVEGCLTKHLYFSAGR